MAGVNPFVGSGVADFYNYGDGAVPQLSGSAGVQAGIADYTAGAGITASAGNGKAHLGVGALVLVALGLLVIFHKQGFRGMVTIGR